MFTGADTYFQTWSSVPQGQGRGLFNKGPCREGFYSWDATECIGSAMNAWLMSINRRAFSHISSLINDQEKQQRHHQRRPYRELKVFLQDCGKHPLDQQ